jgi:predicted RNase H-like HicB family nuclease
MSASQSWEELRARLLADIPDGEARADRLAEAWGRINEYRILLTPDRWDDGTPGFFAEVPDLPGCMSQGRTPDEAVDSVREAMLDWMAVMIEDGHDVPPPTRDE